MEIVSYMKERIYMTGKGHMKRKVYMRVMMNMRKVDG